MTSSELHRVQPDRPPGPRVDDGVHSWPVGSYMPLGFYRPVPIVRFTGTVVLQSLANSLLFEVLYELPGLVTVGACTAMTLLLGWRAFARWLGQASTAWKLATTVALALNLLLLTLASLSPLRSSHEPVPDLREVPRMSDHIVPRPV